MHVRKFKESDRNSVIGLWEACDLTRPWNDPDKGITRKMSIQPELFLVGEVGGDIIASAMAGYDGHRGSVFYLAVAPNHQKSGYGRDLMDEVEKLLISMGCPKLNIIFRSSNQKVLDFYNTLGYSPDDVVSLGKRLIPDA
jgi:ribosomal protein S18 acetylase RimI-like enzyme